MQFKSSVFGMKQIENHRKLGFTAILCSGLAASIIGFTTSSVFAQQATTSSLTVQSTGTISGTLELPFFNPNYNRVITRVDTDENGAYYRNIGTKQNPELIQVYKSEYVRVKVLDDGSMNYHVNFKGIPVTSFDAIIKSPVLSDGEMTTFKYDGRPDMEGAVIKGVVQDEFGVKRAFYTGTLTDPDTGTQYQGKFELSGQGPRYSDRNGGDSPTVFDYKSDQPGPPRSEPFKIQDDSPLVKLYIKVPSGTTILPPSTPPTSTPPTSTPPTSTPPTSTPPTSTPPTSTPPTSTPPTSTPPTTFTPPSIPVTSTPPPSSTPSGTSDPSTGSNSPGTSNPSTVPNSPGNSEPSTVSNSPGTSNPSTVPNSPGNSNPSTVSNSPGNSNPSTVSNSPGTSDPSTVSNSPGTSEPSTVSNSPGTSEPSTVSNSPGTSNQSTVFNSPGTSNQSTVFNSSTLSTPSPDISNVEFSSGNSFVSNSVVENPSNLDKTTCSQDSVCNTKVPQLKQRGPRSRVMMR